MIDAVTRGLIQRNRQFAYQSASHALQEIPVVWEDFEDAPTGWTTDTASVAADTTNYKSGSQGLKVTATSTTGGAGYAQKTLQVAEGGKYWRFRAYVPDATKVFRIQVLAGYGSSPTANYVIENFDTSAGRVVNGWQTFDMHIGRAGDTGTVNHDDDVTLLRLYVYPENGDTAEVTFDLFESVSRRPAIVFVNDEPYLEFTQYVMPLLDARGLSYSVQLLDGTVDSYVSSASARPEGKASLDELRPFLRRGLEFGLHVNCQQATDADFRANLIDQYRAAHSLGVLPAGLHISALQNNWSSTTRRDILKRHAGSMRRGGFNVSGAVIDGQLAMPPEAGAMFQDIPYEEFDHQVTEADVTGWIDDAIANETLLYVFGHGADALNPGQEFRTPLTIYAAFLEHYEANQDKIDWIAPTELWRRSKDARPGGMMAQLSAYSYATE